MEYPAGSKEREDRIKDDMFLEKILRKLGFKPGQMYTYDELTDKICVFYENATAEEIKDLMEGNKSEDPNDLFTEVIDLTNGTSVVKTYFRFASETELKELRELRGEK